MFKIEQHLGPLEQVTCDINVTFLHQKVATFLAGSLESQGSIEIERSRKYCILNTGQMSVGSTFYGTFLPKNCSEKVASFLAGSLEAQY